MFINKIKESFDNERDNYVLWLPVFFIFGIILQFYFKYYDLSLLFLFIICLFLWYYNKNHRYLKLFFICCVFILFGYIRTHYFIKQYNYYALEYPLGVVKIYGFIKKEIINKKFDGSYDKEIIVKVDKIKSLKNNRFIKKVPYLLKIKLQDFNEKIVLGKVILTATVFPIQEKYFQSDFDFKRDMYFKGIGGVGYKGKIIANQQMKSDTITLIQKIDILRKNIAQKIINVRRDASSTSIIAVLLTGQKNLSDKQAVEYMNYSGLSHLLSISGLHMMTLIGLSIFIIKWLLLRTEYFALHHDVFKISATISLIINFIYLLLSGSSVSAVRAYIMSVILLISIIINRFNTSLRSIMFVMFITVFVRPYIIFNVGFQMSFMAVIGLVSCIESYYSYIRNKNKTILDEYISNKFSQYFILGFITSCVAECATTPFSIYTFNNYSFYNVFVNSFLTPLVSFVVLPLGLISLALCIFNLEYLTILPASYVMDFVLYVSKFITEIPNAVMFVRSPNLISMFLMIIGFLWFCLWKRKWRWFGIILYIVGLLIIPLQKRLDVIVDYKNEMIILLEKKDVYVYNPNKYSIGNILKKLGAKDYVEIKDLTYKKCDKKCVIILNNSNIITFIKKDKIINIDKHNLKIIDNINMNVEIVKYGSVINGY